MEMIPAMVLVFYNKKNRSGVKLDQVKNLDYSQKIDIKDIKWNREEPNPYVSFEAEASILKRRSLHS